jgi:hypothetical protein
MRVRVQSAVASLVLLGFAASADAHIKMTSPANWIVTNADGDPQKLGPCGTLSGTRTNQVTVVAPGSKLKVQWTETTFHPGHFRISIATDRSQLVTPPATVVRNSCSTAEIQTTPVLPVIADGIFPHDTRQTQPYTYEITVPNITCDNCTLQLLQFMSSHVPPCFYYSCADLQIRAGADGGVVVRDAGARDGALEAGGDTSGAGGSGGSRDAGAADAAGGSSGSGGASGGGGTSGGGMGGSGGTGGSGPGSGGSGGGAAGTGGSQPKASSGGCSIAERGAGLPATVTILFVFLVLGTLRRARRALEKR